MIRLSKTHFKQSLKTWNNKENIPYPLHFINKSKKITTIVIEPRQFNKVRMRKNQTHFHCKLNTWPKGEYNFISCCRKLRKWIGSRKTCAKTVVYWMGVLKKYGCLPPIILEKKGRCFYHVDGFHRMMACKLSNYRLPILAICLTHKNTPKRTPNKSVFSPKERIDYDFRGQRGCWQCPNRTGIGCCMDAMVNE